MVAEIHALAPEPFDEPAEGFETGSKVIRLKTKPKSDKPAKYVVAFWIDDKPYGVPAKPKANLGLQYLDIVAERGQEVGIAWMLRKMLGDDGYKALLAYDDLEPDELQAVIVKIAEIVNGAMEAPKGS